ncbi:MAG: hypothetical protein ABL926_14345 [Novosphingobium sp.]|uniref:hypothetical protein n=1 Tax=Novosphingobium sp. TaxID=1874826 RepID=UPI0032B807F4
MEYLCHTKLAQMPAADALMLADAWQVANKRRRKTTKQELKGLKLGLESLKSWLLR